MSVVRRQASASSYEGFKKGLQLRGEIARTIGKPPGFIAGVGTNFHQSQSFTGLIGAPVELSVIARTRNCQHLRSRLLDRIHIQTSIYTLIYILVPASESISAGFWEAVEAVHNAEPTLRSTSQRTSELCHWGRLLSRILYASRAKLS